MRITEIQLRASLVEMYRSLVLHRQKTQVAIFLLLNMLFSHILLNIGVLIFSCVVPNLLPELSVSFLHLCFQNEHLPVNTFSLLLLFPRYIGVHFLKVNLISVPIELS